MLAYDEVKDLICDMESDRIERTTSFREDKIGPAVCAFSNDYPNHKVPGYLLFGVNDDGSIAGQTITDQELRNLGGIRSNGNILPQPSVTVSQVYHFGEGDVVVMEVYPSLIPPVRYNGRVYIRIGPRKSIANEAEERRLSEKRTSQMKTYDVRPCPESTIDDLQIDIFKTTYLPSAVDREIIQKNNRDLKQQLASLRLYDIVHDCPTNAGILLLGINPLYFIPGAYIQYVKFPGNNFSPEVELEKKFSGALVTELGSIENFIKDIVIKTRPLRNDERMQEFLVSNYPLWALREFIMNAIMHRDYESNAPIYFYDFSDHIEIINPGGLYGEVRQENFPDASDYRNPELGEAMKTLGYVNRFNYGVRNAQSILKESGNGEAGFRLDLITKFSVSIPVNKHWR